jgi:tetratricopeptide repeat protein
VLGMVAKERGDLAAAADFFDASVRHGGSLSARRRLIVTLALEGRADAARRALDEALAVAPDDPLLSDLRRLVPP